MLDQSQLEQRIAQLRQQETRSATAHAYESGYLAGLRAVRNAILDVLDAQAWAFKHDESDEETENRMTFVDAVMGKLK